MKKVRGLMRRLSIAWVALLGLCVTAAAADEKGLVAHWDFNEGKGDVLHDKSGNSNHGKIHGAAWVECGKGYALKFDGVNDWVDCGAGASLDLRGPMTIMGWVCAAVRQPATEPWLWGKQFSSFLATYWVPRDLFCWYLNWGTGGNYTGAVVSAGRWLHLATVYDGKLLKVYLNGTLSAKVDAKVASVNPGKNFVLGSVIGDPQARDPNFAVTAGFKGFMDEVKVYSRALGDEEIAEEYRAGATEERDRMLAVLCKPVTAAERIRREDVSISVGRNGAVQIQKGSAFFVLESRFSYPGARIGWNRLSAAAAEGDPEWKRQVRKVDDSHVQIEATCRLYAFRRDIQFRDGRIELSDALASRTENAVGVIVEHRLSTPETMACPCASEAASAPLVFFSQSGADFGILTEDHIGRLQLDSVIGRNEASIRHGNFALDGGKSYTFRYAIYALPATGDVYELVNRVRRDWNINFTLLGPFQFLGATDSMLKDPAALKRYLDRKNLNLVALSPFVDYDPGGMDHVISREEFKALGQEAAAALREARPSIKVLGCIETDWVTIWPEKMKDGHVIAERGEAIARVIDQANLPWKDSIKRGADGTVRIEYYTRGGKPQFALGVYPAPGNYQHKFLLEQAEFLMDEVGLDGFYIDEFSQAWGGAWSYEGWDGCSVEIDPDTGKILRKHVDCGLVGIQPRVDIINAALKRGKIIVANSYATSAAEQSLPAQRFAETQRIVPVGIVGRGKKPHFVPHIFDGTLASPIGLGVVRTPERPNLPEGLMLAVICYLRHGAVIYHYAYPELPETGEGSGEYGPINHMFPITPVRLFQGGIEGKERTITCVSGTYQWRGQRPPRILLFDEIGKEKKHNFKTQRADAGWKVVIELRDWQEIAVIEEWRK